MNVNTITRPLALFEADAICDGCGHEMRLTTDGITAYAATIPSPDYEQTEFLRAGTIISAACPRPANHVEDDCHGAYAWDLSMQAWGPANRAGLTSLGFGGKMDVAS